MREDPAHVARVHSIINQGQMKRFTRTAAIILGTWTLVGLATGTNSYLLSLASQYPASFRMVLYRSLVEHWIWAALTPPILWVSRQLPFSKKTAVRAFACHFSFFIAVSLLH